MSHRPPTPAVAMVAIEYPRSSTLTASDVPPIRIRSPYAVERLPAAPGFVHFVGYDGRGEYMTEWTIPTRTYTEDTPAKFRRWLMQHDDTPPTLSLLPG